MEKTVVLTTSSDGAYTIHSGMYSVANGFIQFKDYIGNHQDFTSKLMNIALPLSAVRFLQSSSKTLTIDIPSDVKSRSDIVKTFLDKAFE